MQVVEVEVALFKDRLPVVLVLVAEPVVVEMLTAAQELLIPGAVEEVRVIVLVILEGLVPTAQ
jgi:hypothetical protein